MPIVVAIVHIKKRPPIHGSVNCTTIWVELVVVTIDRPLNRTIISIELVVTVFWLPMAHSMVI